MSLDKNKISSKVIVLLLLSVSGFFIFPFIGMSSIPATGVFNDTLSEAQNQIFWSIRIPRVILAYFVGASLALAGVVFQALFRNNLVCPFTLGISSAAALGAALYFKFGKLLSIPTSYGAAAAAFIGAFLSIVSIFLISRNGVTWRNGSILLVGVATGFFCSSMVVFIQYVSNFTEMFSITRWLMGSLDVIGYRTGIVLILTSLMSLLVIYCLGRDLDLISVDDDFAESRGVELTRVRAILFVITSLLVGLTVSLCGIIGFVGIMVPHIARLLVGVGHRTLIVAAFLLGGFFLLTCDTIARSIIPPSEIPVGILTSLLGAPFFMYLLFFRTGRN